MIKEAEARIEINGGLDAKPARIRGVNVELVADGSSMFESTGKTIVIHGDTIEDVLAQIAQLKAEGKIKDVRAQ